MKNAPNLKHLPKDKFIEAIIFAGADAYAHAQHWIESEGKKHGDNVPPVYLGKKQLADLANMRIVDKGRRFARVYLSGEIEPIAINAIAEKLAIAGVQEAKLYKGIPDRTPEDWHDYLVRLREQAEHGETLVDEYNKSQGKRLIATGLDLAQMAASQRAKILAEYYGKIAITPESGVVYVFNGAIWEKVTDNELRRTMGAIFDENDTPYSPKGIDAAIDAMKIQIPVMGEPSRDLIGFENGVYDIKTHQFKPHHEENWLVCHNGIIWTESAEGENLYDHAPHFWRWLSHATSGNTQKAERIKAALFMVLAQRHDWQLFIEVTGEGGSGKSIFTVIAMLLAGEHNCASGNMATLDSARGRAQFVDKRLIILPDQIRYVGEGAGIKAITGGDPVEIDGKYEKQFTTVINAVVIATNNEPMTFTERNGGIARRRVIFPFDNQVKDAEKDPQLPEKIRGEIPVIIRHLLKEFSDPNHAKALLLEQRQSLEALNVKRGTDPVIDMCAALFFMNEPRGLMMGGGTWAGQPEPRKYLYHLYLAFLEYHGMGKPLSVEKFSRAMRNAAKEYREEYQTRKINGRTQTNVGLDNAADEFLPRAFGLEIPDDDTPL